MKTIITVLLLLICSCVSKTPYQWLDQSKIDKTIPQINQYVDEMNKELVAMCKKENLELVEKVPYVESIEVSLNGKSIRVNSSKVYKHDEFSQSYSISLEGRYRDEFQDHTYFSTYFLKNE